MRDRTPLGRRLPAFCSSRAGRGAARYFLCLFLSCWVLLVLVLLLLLLGCFFPVLVVSATGAGALYDSLGAMLGTVLGCVLAGGAMLPAALCSSFLRPQAAIGIAAMMMIAARARVLRNTTTP